MVLRLDKEDGAIPQWTLILGDNGIGKSTLLQGIAWMQPLIPYADDDEGDDKVEPPEPRITDEENETLLRLVRKTDATTTEESAIIRAVFIANKKLNQKKSSEAERTFETSTTIKLVNRKLRNVISGVSEGNDDLFLKQEVLIYGYSASRRLGKLNLGDPSLVDTIPSFIAENTILYDAEEILNQSDYAALSSEGEEKKEYQKYIEQIKKMLVSVLPDVKKISDINILAPTFLGNIIRPGGVVITTKHGEKIPFSDMSLGYKNVISWTIDLTWRLSRQYSDSTNPLAEPAIVLIDEIDLHLHPKWQREIMSNLSRHFKNTQFIATAHSPLMLQAAIESNYAVLKENENGLTILNEPKGIDGWRVDQILTSEMFGLPSARGIEYEELYSKREKLVNKKRLSSEEKAKLEVINEEMSKLPSGERPDEIENRKLISEIVSNIKKNKEKIDL